MNEAVSAVLEALKALTIPFEYAEHPRVSSIEECHIAEELLGALVPRNYFLCPRNRAGFYLLTADPANAFRTSSVSKQAGASRLSFAPEEDLNVLLHTHAGAVSPLGIMHDVNQRVKFLFDRNLLTREYLVFHPLENTASVRLRTSDLLYKFMPAYSHDVTFIDM